MSLPQGSPRPDALPLVCGSPSGRAGRVGHGCRGQRCSRCPAPIEVNIGVVDGHHQRGELVEAICQRCWSDSDRESLAARRKA